MKTTISQRWASHTVNMYAPEFGPCAWETLLQRKRISHDEAIDRALTDPELRQWIARNFEHRYVPETALSAQQLTVLENSPLKLSRGDLLRRGKA